MSGLCGIVDFRGASVDPRSLEAMVASAATRARDGIGRWLEDAVGLAHLHLNLTPESQGECQPLARDGLVITASARIDNRAELLPRMAAAGWPLAANVSDAELILATYRLWGQDCAARLLGDFAFAIWDGPRQGLFAARDPMGLRPFYYRYQATTCHFASEACQIRAIPGRSAPPRAATMALHLAAMTAPEDWTFFEGVSVLPAAHSFWCDHRGARVWRHWQAPVEPLLLYPHDQDYSDHFLQVFEQAVRARLNSVHPVAVWLSGGLDSGSVAAMAGWLRAREPDQAWPLLRSHSWRFETLLQCDERHISDLIVRQYGLISSEIPAETHAPFAPGAARVTHPDEPLIQVYSPLLEASLRLARDQGVGLILSGFRGDPMSESGDFDYLELLLGGRWGTIARDLIRLRRHAPHWSLHRVLKNRFLRPLGIAMKNAPGLHAAATILGWLLGGGWARRLAALPSWLEPGLMKGLGLDGQSPALAPDVGLPGLARPARHRAIFFPGYYRAAVEQERHNAAFGIGYADPWSDRRLVELILRFPPRIISRIGEEKRISRRAMRGIMPEEARMQARKIVPTPLFERVLRQDARAEILELFTGSRLAARGFVTEPALIAAYERYLQGDHREEGGFWNTITAELWLREQEA
jgi:asparagine synthase (glutamine-hydrolysing)